MWAEVCDLNYVGRSVYPAEYNISLVRVVVVRKIHRGKPVRSINRPRVAAEQKRLPGSGRAGWGVLDIAGIAAAAAAAATAAVALLQAILKFRTYVYTYGE